MGGSWRSFEVAAGDLALATDLYQLTMAAAYHRRDPSLRGCFELTVRGLPPRRNFLVFAGLEQALAALSEIRFSDRQVDWVRQLPPFESVEDDFFERLRSFRFRGSVRAMGEGSVFFPGEPVLEVSGDLLEAQIVETLLLSVINFQTAVASKAARMRLAAGEGVQLAEFGTRRAHGPQAGMWAARAAWLAGFDSTSNVLAGQRLGIPVVGTMAHSFVMSARGESEAFRDYHRVFPDHSIFLVDTFDTLEGVEAALDLGVPFVGVRLDSGDLEQLSRQVRRRLDERGAGETMIFASGDVDEHVIASLRRAGAAHRRLRCRLEALHFRRRAVPGRRVQADRGRRGRGGPAGVQVEPRQDHLARAQAGGAREFRGRVRRRPHGACRRYRRAAGTAVAAPGDGRRGDRGRRLARGGTSSPGAAPRGVAARAPRPGSGADSLSGARRRRYRTADGVDRPHRSRLRR